MFSSYINIFNLFVLYRCYLESTYNVKQKLNRVLYFFVTITCFTKFTIIRKAHRVSPRDFRYSDKSFVQ